MVLFSKKAYRHPFSVKNADGTPFFITFVHNINKKTTIKLKHTYVTTGTETPPRQNS